MSSAHENPRAFLRALYDAAVARALPGEVIGRFLPAPPKGRTLVLGAGKAGGAMAAAVDALWPKDAPLSGLVVTRYDYVPPAYKARPGRIEVVEAAHPVPDDAGQRAAQRIVELTRGLTKDDLVLSSSPAAVRPCCRCRPKGSRSTTSVPSTRPCCAAAPPSTR